jgi:hypothetical protein
MIEIRKKYLFFLLQEKKFKFSQKFMKENIILVQNYIEKQCKKKFKTPFPKQIISLLEREFRKLIYAYKRSNGGKQRESFYKIIEKDTIKFEMDGISFENSNLNPQNLGIKNFKLALNERQLNHVLFTAFFFQSIEHRPPCVP